MWITANAGSGKTTYLTERVLGLLLRGVQPERICCITYTKAAASEMRHRVLSKLRALLLMDDTECAGRIEALLGRPATAEDKARARGLFGAVLDSPTGGLQLTTIHGFCQTILRRFPLEAGISPHFTVLEEAAADRLITREKYKLLHHYQGEDTALNAALELIANRASESRFDSYIAESILRRSHWEEVWRGQSPTSLRAAIFAANGLEPEDTAENLVAGFTHCVTETQAATIRACLPELQNHEKPALQHMGRILAGWLECDAAHRAGLIDPFCLLFLTKEGEIRKTLLAKKDFPESSPLREVLAVVAECAYRYHIRRAALASAEESFAIALLARALLQLYAQAKTAAHALDYDDLIGLTRQLFANPAMLGWVMTKLDHRIDHLLIDEAQDTSGEQWSITDLLVEELIAAGGIGSGDVPRSLLVVGDEKQSIYSFQGAAPELFAQAQTGFEAKLKGSEAPLASEALTHSYRSAEAVLSLVDHLATQPEIAAALSATGGVEKHQLVRHPAQGEVVLYPPLVAPDTMETPALRLPRAYTISQTAPQQLAEQVATQLEGWFASNRQLASEGRALTPGDVLILVRSRTSIVLPLIRALERKKIPVAGLDRLTLSTHLAVRDLLALMGWVLNPGDDLSLAQVLRSPLIGMSDDALRAACCARPGSLYAQLGHQPLLEQARSLRNARPYDFLTEILEVLGTRRQFATRFGEEVQEVLDELKSQAVLMPEGMAETLANFRDWMEGSARQIKREQEGPSNRVRIMTVHGAKGLEAPVVLLVDTVNVPTTQKEVLYFTRTSAGQKLPALAISEEAKAAALLIAAKERKADSLLAEYYRLLYVALTRARDELHIFGTASKKGNVPPKSWYAKVEHSLQLLGAEEVEGKRILRDRRPVAAPTLPASPTSPLPTLPGWTTTAPRRAAPRVTKLTPSQLLAEETPTAYAATGESGQRARGVRIHRLLELITAETDAATLLRLSQRIAPDWEEREREAILQNIAALQQSEAWIWRNPSHAEVNIGGNLTIEGRQVALSGQIDRLVEMPDAVVVLDYKTGKHIPASAAAISETYRLQLKTYQALLAQLYPGKPVRTAIVWTAAPSLMWCDDAVAATPWHITPEFTAA